MPELCRISRVQCKHDNSCSDTCDFHIMMKRVNLRRRDSPLSLVKYTVLHSHKVAVLLGCPSHSLVKHGCTL